MSRAQWQSNNSKWPMGPFTILIPEFSTFMRLKRLTKGSKWPIRNVFYHYEVNYILSLFNQSVRKETKHNYIDLNSKVLFESPIWSFSCLAKLWDSLWLKRHHFYVDEIKKGKWGNLWRNLCKFLEIFLNIGKLQGKSLER